MALTRAQKVQVEAVKKPEAYYAQNYDYYTMITDGVSGFYIRPEELVINPAKLKPHDGGMESLDPEKILTDTVRTERTKTAMILDKRLAVKFTGAGGAVGWVNLSCLKGYDTGEVAYYLNGSLGVIVFVDRNTDEPVGFTMTMKIDEE